MNHNSRFERGALVVLSVMLIFVFAASVYMYDAIAEGTENGALYVFAENARELVYENEAVAAFLGIEYTEQTVCYEEKDIGEAAVAYIERYNKIYENNR